MWKFLPIKISITLIQFERVWKWPTTRTIADPTHKLIYTFLYDDEVLLPTH